MKKVIVLFLVVLCTFSAFAAKQAVSVKCAPIVTQISTSSEEPDYTVDSKYGIGAEASYRYYLVKGLYADGGLSWNTYLLPEGRPALTSLMAFGGVGYDCRLSKEFSIGGHAEIGADTLLYDKTGSETITLKTGIECIYHFENEMAITFGCDGTFGFAKKAGTNYVNYRILPAVGMSVDL